MRHLRLLITGLILMLGHSVQTFAQDVPAPAGPAIEIGDAVIADSEIRGRIQTIFREIDGLGGIRVMVSSGVVTLSGQVEEAVLAQRAEDLVNRVSGVVAIENRLTEQTEVTERLKPVIGRFENRLRQTLDYLPLLMVAGLVWLMIGLFGWFVTTRTQPWNWLTPNAFIADLLRQTVWLAFLMLGALMALDILGATAVLGTVIGAVGIIGLAIGFAVKDTVENYIASILLSIRQPFQPRDFIALEGMEGYVIRLTSRATILMDIDGNHIRIPNAAVFKATIINYTRNPERRFSFELGIDADSALHEALTICHDTLAGLGFVLPKPEPGAWIEKVGDSNVLIGVSGWINQTETDYAKARSEAIRTVKTALETAGFALPEPIYRLRFDPASQLGDLAEATTGTGAKTRTGPKPGAGKKPAAKTPPGSPAAPQPAPADQVTDTAVDPAVLKKVDDERQQQPDADLLTGNGEDEMGARPVI
ncbi:MAG: mechanosensitive ion channel [Hoeflea sp.]|uniref:mechanosensitive ion channel domain-containing protein n=1 Tax=Hoeflea sp. TaxID=1940281 RepID=UPI001DCA6BBA|nr:mechanosensitive ion channel domain-containing protein [Hoeflea sp.]MBU4529616.1 mechanosensitive ion channel [Alphaproteobacteria bacterium]MBU4546735.1 mechanosensitive ion channel [Alphaproteobacteria bacterium]MBU4551003.1 mechanosensitive ion channel [Alphaproteobacteria bacterium]MBV1723945.1 mechanosensitive ion channel [Hoeflea sp.]MBV1763222.1 mechanosensitive ion channel [Hoeflea sp.]